MTQEHFAEIYKVCDDAKFPVTDGKHYSAADWWRALLTFTYMTGWRIGEPMSLQRGDLDLENETAITWAKDNKGKRDEIVPLNPVVVDHLRKIISFGEDVFEWNHGRRTLWREFTRLQQIAGIHLPCGGDHEHTDACHVYGFHDLRRAFATMNVETLSGDALQSLMRHKSYTTTQGYINMANHVKQSADNLFVPDVLKADRA